MNRIPPIHALLAFDSAARHGSMAAAAEELCVTPSAISHRIKQLEEFIGMTLIERGGSQWWLTAAGHDYLRAVRNGLAALATLPRTPLLRQQVRVAVPPTFGRVVLVPHLADFMKRFPEIDLTIQMTIPLLDVRAEDADVEVRFGSGLYADVQAEPLLRDAVFAACSPEYRKTHGPFKKPADLARALLLKSPLEPWRAWLDAAGLDWPEPSAGVQYNDVGLMMEAALCHQGVLLARQSLAAPLLASGALVRLFDVSAKPPHAYWLTYRAANLQREEVRSFVDWLKSVVV